MPISIRNNAASPASPPPTTGRCSANRIEQSASPIAIGFGPGPVGNAIAPATASHASSASG